MRDYLCRAAGSQAGALSARRCAGVLSQRLGEAPEHRATWPALPSVLDVLIWRLLVMPRCCLVQLCRQLLALPAITAGIAELAGLSLFILLVKAAAAVE